MRSEEPDKDFEAKKTPHPAAANQTSHSSGKSGQAEQSGQATGRPNRKDSRSCRGGSRGQSNNTPATGVNATTVKKSDKKADKELSQVECYNCHKKGHYANKCPDKQAKN